MDTNRLFYGDNLPILRQYFPSESVDLIYLDPPFNSNRNYSAIFADESGRKSDAQIHAFEDSWHWGPTPEAHLAYLTQSTLHGGAVPVGVSQLIAALQFALGKTPMMAYLVEMSVRLVELRRVLKATGSLYLHCDPTASHYLKAVLDALFGPTNFRNEIIWKRTSGHSDARGYGAVHDTILYYARSERSTWNESHQPYDPEYVENYYRYRDPDGRRFMSGDLGAAGLSGGGYEYEWRGVTRVWRVPLATMERLEAESRIFYTKNGMPRLKRYLDESKGLPVQDVWTDIEPIRSWHPERLGYPTQKPRALLERIIATSSNPGDVVLDPFCGCGTALMAAQKLERRWIGIDITYMAIAVMRHDLERTYGLRDIPVIGKPTEVAGARMLAESGPEGRYQFQWWVLDEIGAMPASGERKKGADTGIDGRITFTKRDGSLGQAIVSVKSGRGKADDVRVLKAVIEREQAGIGILVTLDEPTKPMTHEATVAGTFYSDVSDRDYPRIQILSAADILERGRRPELPPLIAAPYRQPPKVGAAPAVQPGLFEAL